MAASTRSRWMIGLLVAGVVVVVLVVAYAVGESRRPGGFDGLQSLYIALGVLIPLFVYVFGVGPLSALGGAPEAEAAELREEPAQGAPTLEAATASGTRKPRIVPAVAGATAEKQTAAGPTPTTS